MMKWGGKTTLFANAAAGNSNGSWISCALFTGTDGKCTIRGYGTFDSGTLTIQESDNAAGTGPVAITSAAFTAAFSNVFEFAHENFVRVVLSTSAGASTLTVTAAPHSRAG